MKITLEEVNKVWGNADFGDKGSDKIAYIKQALNKIKRGYCNGWTITKILIDLKLISPVTIKLTKRGKCNL